MKIFLLLLLLILGSSSLDIELTVIIPNNQRECFHQQMEIGMEIEIEYEVLTGGDFDINYWFYSPTNRVLQSDFKKRDGHQRLKLEETGEFQFCFDNSFSRFNQKQIYFSVRSVENNIPSSTDPWMNNIHRDELGDLQSKVQQFKDTFQRIWDNMETSQRYQNAFRNYELQDRSIAEENFERVNFWSIVHLSLMIFLSFLQVFTIRSLFETKSKYGKFLRGKN